MIVWNRAISATAPLSEAFSMEAALRELAPNLARAACETASAFFGLPAALTSSLQVPRIPEQQRLVCSQKNLGDKFEMICNLHVDAEGFSRLFPAGTSARIRMDAYCELANCISGALIADPDFMDWFGCLAPCVPCSGRGCIADAAHAIKGALRLDGTWILFSVSMARTGSAATGSDRLAAAA